MQIEFDEEPRPMAFERAAAFSEDLLENPAMCPWWRKREPERDLAHCRRRLSMELQDPRGRDLGPTPDLKLLKLITQLEQLGMC